MGNGCARKPTAILPIETRNPKVGKIITIGTIVDNRFPFWPRKENTPPPLEKKGKSIIKDFEPLSVIKEVRIPMGEIRSTVAKALKASRRFEEIINPPTQLTGSSLPQMLKQCLQTSDYLIVGEVNSFYTRDAGRNKVGDITLPIDLIMLGLPNLVGFFATGGKALLFSSVFFAGHDAECVLSMSLTIYSVESGNPITTLRIEEHAQCAIDTVAVFGDIGNPEDDWVDIGRRLGEIALANASRKAIDFIARALQREQQSTTPQ